MGYSCLSSSLGGDTRNREIKSLPAPLRHVERDTGVDRELGLSLLFDQVVLRDDGQPKRLLTGGRNVVELPAQR
jgi:hypothetical protein